MKYIILAVIVAQLTGCAAVTEWANRDPRDAPWDPKASHGQTLFDQMPNWDNAAEKICAGHLRPDQRRPGQTDRC